MPSSVLASLKYDCLVQTGVVAIVHNQMLHGQMLYCQMVLGHLLTVKDGSTNLKCPPRYFPWGVGGEKLKLMLTQSS